MKLIHSMTLAAVFTLVGSHARADELGDKGREIFNQNRKAIVTVQVVREKITYTAPGRAAQPQESKQDLTGTVVDGSGLTVLALSVVDPASMYESMMAGSDEGSRFKLESEVSDVKILTDDGTELPAEVVLRDKDLDLAFIRPKASPSAAMPAVDFAKSSTAQVLDQVITLNRLGKAAGRAYCASVERISAVVQKPRTFYIPDSTVTATGLGSPAFALDGKVVGLFVMRTVSARSGGATMNNLRQDNATSIILPAADVLKAAKQASEAKGDDEKKEAKTAAEEEEKK